jgi:hypothetical protein
MMMKKILLFLLAAVLVSCSKEKEDIRPQWALTEGSYKCIGDTLYLSDSYPILPSYEVKSQDERVAKIRKIGNDYIVIYVSEGSTSITVTEKGKTIGEILLNIVDCDKLRLEQFYLDYCYGYHVTDTAELVVFSHSIIEDEPNVAYLSGTRRGKLWFAAFDNSSREQLYEVTAPVVYDPIIRIDLGYGEYETHNINRINVNNVIESEKGRIFSTDAYNSNHYKQFHILFFIGENHYKRVFTDGASRSWYNGTCLNDFRGKYIVFDAMGEEIGSGITDFYTGTNCFPVSYLEFISISGSGFYNDLNEFVPCLRIVRDEFREEYVSEPNKSVYLPIIDDSNARFTTSLVSTDNNIWTFKIDVTEYSGRKHSHEVVLNIDTFEVVYK